MLDGCRRSFYESKWFIDRQQTYMALPSAAAYGRWLRLDPVGSDPILDAVLNWTRFVLSCTQLNLGWTQLDLVLSWTQLIFDWDEESHPQI